MDFNEAEWVLADAVETADGDWVVADCPEGSVSGVFFHRPRLSYAAFGRLCPSIPDPSLSFLPPSVSVRCSSRGLLLLRGPWSVYYVCNPDTAQCSRIPRPPRPHTAANEPAALALVARPDNPSRLHLVCAFDVSDAAYRFEIFSSASGEWRTASAAVTSTGRIVPGSGVAAAGMAYWRTAAPGVIAYDPEADEARIIPPPPVCMEAGGRWQLGEASDHGLCCACVTGSEIVVYRLDSSDRWAPIGSFGVKVVGDDGAEKIGGAAARSQGKCGDLIICKEPPWPLRFESANLEVVLWVDGRLLAVDLESRWVREVRFDDGGPAPACDEEYVAHISTLTPVAPLGSG